MGRSGQSTMNDIIVIAGKLSFLRTIRAPITVGGIVGNASQTNIVNSSFQGSIGQTTTITPVATIGGLIGSYSGTGNYFVNNCTVWANIEFSNANIFGDENRIGGVIGYSSASGSIMTNTFFEEGNITITSSNIVHAGGFCGVINAYEINNCGVLGGTLNIDTSNSVITAGGFSSSFGGNLSNCFSKMNIITKDAPGANIGGLLGSLNGASSTVDNCYATGFVDSTVINNTTSFDNLCIGGLIGYINANAGSISNCYALGNVFADKKGTQASQTLMVGGLVGEIFRGDINNCFSTGQVKAQTETGAAYAGGLVGYWYSGYAGDITNCAVSGAAVIANGGTKAAGRISGYPADTTPIGNGNRAAQSMLTYEGTYGQTLFTSSTPIGLGNHQQRQGQAYGDNEFLNKSFWTGTGSLGFDPVIWSFNKVGSEGFPRLKNLDGQ